MNQTHSSRTGQQGYSLAMVLGFMFLATLAVLGVAKLAMSTQQAGSSSFHLVQSTMDTKGKQNATIARLAYSPEFLEAAIRRFQTTGRPVRLDDAGTGKAGAVAGGGMALSPREAQILQGLFGLREALGICLVLGCTVEGSLHFQSLLLGLEPEFLDDASLHFAERWQSLGSEAVEGLGDLLPGDALDLCLVGRF